MERTRARSTAEDENALFVGATNTQTDLRSCARQRGKATRLCPLCLRENASSATATHRRSFEATERKVFEQVTYELGFKV